MFVASRLAPLLDELLGGPVPVRLRAWDGSTAGPADAGVTVIVRRRRALRRLLWAPNELGLARAFVSGDLDVEGDLDSLLRLPEAMAGRPRLSAARGRAARTLLALGAIGPPPAAPPEEARVSGHRHNRSSDRAAISHHYDIGNDFYRLVLGETMTYSCAYWAEPGFDLDAAQLAKADLIARKLDLRAGMRLLDIGCGWGTLVLRAAQQYGVRAVGVTISEQQAELGRKRVAEAGLTDRVEIRLQDYRDIDDGPYDAISSVGMAEHVGAERLPEYAGVLHRLLAPGRRVLNHQITRATPDTGRHRISFIDRYVFPDGELLPLGRIVGGLEDAGLEVRDVESLREHYTRTLRAWVANLEASWDEAARLTSPGRARVWRLYMAGAAHAFDLARISVHQVLAVKPGPGGASGMPPTRAEWLGSPP